MPQLPPELGGGPSSVLTRGIRWAAVGIESSPHKALRLVIKSEDAQAAEALRGKLVDLLRLAGQRPDVRKRVPEFEAVAAFLTPKVEGDRLTVSSDEKTESFEKALVAIMQPMLEAEARLASMNSLKEIGLGMHNYYFANKHFPLPASRSPDGKPLLSWRVHLLPLPGADFALQAVPSRRALGQSAQPHADRQDAVGLPPADLHRRSGAGRTISCRWETGPFSTPTSRSTSKTSGMEPPIRSWSSRWTTNMR